MSTKDVEAEEEVHITVGQHVKVAGEDVRLDLHLTCERERIRLVGCRVSEG